MLQMALRHFIPAFPNIIVVAVNPGLCKSSLFRNSQATITIKSLKFGIRLAVLARSSGGGARNLCWAMLNAFESHEVEFRIYHLTTSNLGVDAHPIQYWHDCAPSFSRSQWMHSMKGLKASRAFFEDIISEFERLVPGSTNVLAI